MKAIACISAGGVCRGRNGDAFVGDRSAAGGAGKLSYHPAVCEVIIEHDWIAAATGLAGATKARPDRGNAIRSQK
ncbi:MAG: hypothetical protein DME66_07795 [Verrucomicrobia bacterium]|nr:MAG: hypothetical protein DME66_07795 [Verrucomicrobiota bacterium]